MSLLKIAGVQMDIEFANPKSNLEKLTSRFSETIAQGAPVSYTHLTLPTIYSV